MREIEVETFLNPMNDGISKPALVIGDDQKEYIIKNQQVYENGKYVEYDCMFLNEMLAFYIGDYLGVPMPEAVVAKVNQESIDADAKIRFAYRFEEGKYFATKELKKVENNILKNYKMLLSMRKPYIIKPWNKFFKDVNNKEDIAKILAFDILIANFDRYNNIGNILVDNTDERKIYAIDHGHSFFRPIWDQEKIKCLGIAKVTPGYINLFANNIIVKMKQAGACGAGIIFGALEQHINLEDLKKHSFSEVILKIREISEEMILNWCNSIPDEW